MQTKINTPSQRLRVLWLVALYVSKLHESPIHIFCMTIPPVTHNPANTPLARHQALLYQHNYQTSSPILTPLYHQSPHTIVTPSSNTTPPTPLTLKPTQISINHSAFGTEAGFFYNTIWVDNDLLLYGY